MTRVVTNEHVASRVCPSHDASERDRNEVLHVEEGVQLVCYLRLRPYPPSTMASMLEKLLAQDITDSTDFPDDATTPGLRSFDDALRCGICRDFYDAPVSLPCGHCFCSAVRECRLLRGTVARNSHIAPTVHTFRLT